MVIWRVSFDGRSPTWATFGKVVFVDAATREAAHPLARAAAQEMLPGMVITLQTVEPSTAAAREAHQAHLARVAAWTEAARTATARRGLL